jgi:hypothetical protein
MNLKGLTVEWIASTDMAKSIYLVIGVQRWVQSGYELQNKVRNFLTGKYISEKPTSALLRKLLRMYLCNLKTASYYKIQVSNVFEFRATSTYVD